MSEKRRVDIDELLGREDVEKEFRRTLGVRTAIVDDDGYYALELKIRRKHLNRMGIAHGGVVFSLCDTTAGTCVSYNKGVQPVTQDGSIRYYKPVREGDTIRAVASVRKAGRTVFVVNVEALNQNDELVADTVFTMYNK